MKKIVIILLFRKIKFAGTEHEDKTEVFMITHEFDPNLPAQSIANDIWLKLINQESKYMRQCYVPELVAKTDELKLEQVTVAGENKYDDWHLLATFINEKIRKAKEACSIIFEITSRYH